MNDIPADPKNGSPAGDGGSSRTAPGKAPERPSVVLPTAPPPLQPSSGSLPPPPRHPSAGAVPAQPPALPLEEARKQINQILEQIARMAELDIPAAEFFGEFLKRMRESLSAKGGAVWCRTPQGNLQLQYQIEMQNVGINQSEESRRSHDELLRQAMVMGRPIHLPPHSSNGTPAAGAPAFGNPTAFLLLIVPILLDKQVVGLVELWQSADRHPSAITGFLNFMSHMAELAARYLRNQKTAQLSRQQSLWGQLEAFARLVHSSLNPVEVAYTIANEARRLIECDRVSVGVRYGRRIRVEAVSGADQVERRSNLVKLQRALFEAVIEWGEKLVFTGAADETLPPKVHTTLNAYLEESASRLLVVLPLRDEREKDSKLPPRSALMLECFEPQEAPEQFIARLDVVGKHCAPALYNAIEHKRIPFRFVWMPLAKVQEGLGGKAKAITFLVVLALALTVAAFVLIPYPLKVDSTGELQPEVWANVFVPEPSTIVEFCVPDHRLAQPGEAPPLTQEGGEAFIIYAPKIGAEITNLENEINRLQKNRTMVLKQLNESKGESVVSISNEIRNIDKTLAAKEARLVSLKDPGYGYTPLANRPNMFAVKLPLFPKDRDMDGKGYKWTVLSSGFDNLVGREVKPSEPVLRVGYTVKPPDVESAEDPRWQVEMKIPQKHIGQVLKAFTTDRDDEELDVDLLVKSAPTNVYKGKLARSRISGEAKPQQQTESSTESEPVVYAWVRIRGDDIRADDQVPEKLLKTGTEVHAKIRCGSHKLGYSLFYGIWEFFYEKVVFFF